MSKDELACSGVGRMFDNDKALLVMLNRKPTDDELRAFHDRILAALRPTPPDDLVEQLAQLGIKAKVKMIAGEVGEAGYLIDQMPVVARAAFATQPDQARTQAIVDEEERAVLQLIAERDAAEDALSQAFKLVVGQPVEWSNLFGYPEALEAIEERVLTLSATQQPLEADVVGWQPIETAPRDDRETYDTPMPRECIVLLAFHSNDVGQSQAGICVGYWDAHYAPGGSGYYEGCSEWVIADYGETTNLHYSSDPTHWMPLPAPPSLERLSSQGGVSHD